MKEWLITGVAVAAMTLFGTHSTGPVCETVCPSPAKTVVSEGFMPHETVTRPPVTENISSDNLLPDFGSTAYL